MILLIALAGTPAMAQPLCKDPAKEASLHDAERDASVCIVSATRRLEPSGEPAQELATLALQECSEARAAAMTIYDTECNTSWWSGRRAIHNEGFRDVEVDSERLLAIRTVAETRAKRASAP